MKKIIHIDMDAFYAAVEQRDNPDLRGKPVIVGGNPNQRGVVATCSYEARKFGIHSAMSSKRAFQLCPQAIFLKPRFHVYKEVSNQIRSIFHEYTDLVEPLSLDEAYLDVTENKKNMVSATMIAEEIKKAIFQTTGLTASAGISSNKFLAKIASDINKPDGVKLIHPDEAESFIEKLPIRKFFGIGPATEEKMLSLGIKTGLDLKRLTKEKLIENFGKSGTYFYSIARGVDTRDVEPNRLRKSYGKERTFHKDIDDMEFILNVLEEIAADIQSFTDTSSIKGKTIVLKVKYFDFNTATRSFTSLKPIVDSTEIMKIVNELLKKTKIPSKKIRLIGITLTNLINEKENENAQLDLPF